MPTTIQISDTTKQLLDWMKRQRPSASYDELVEGLLQAQMKIPKSIRGLYKGMRWKSSDRAREHEL